MTSLVEDDNQESFQHCVVHLHGGDQRIVAEDTLKKACGLLAQIRIGSNGDHVAALHAGVERGLIQITGTKKEEKYLGNPKDYEKEITEVFNSLGDTPHVYKKYARMAVENPDIGFWRMANPTYIYYSFRDKLYFMEFATSRVYVPSENGSFANNSKTLLSITQYCFVILL